MKKLTMLITLIVTLMLGVYGAALATSQYDDPGGGHTPVVICHKPGTPAQQELTVDDDAVPAHLAHGDTLGPCPPEETTVEPPEETTVAPPPPCDRDGVDTDGNGFVDEPGDCEEDEVTSEPTTPEETTVLPPEETQPEETTVVTPPEETTVAPPEETTVVEPPTPEETTDEPTQPDVTQPDRPNAPGNPAPPFVVDVPLTNEPTTIIVRITEVEETPEGDRLTVDVPNSSRPVVVVARDRDGDGNVERAEQVKAVRSRVDGALPDTSGPSILFVLGGAALLAAGAIRRRLR